MEKRFGSGTRTSKKISIVQHILGVDSKETQMKRWLAIFCMCALSGAVEAGTDPFVGSFTHDYTRLKNDSVWTVKKTGATWQVRVPGSNETVRARPISKTERGAFWEQM